MIRIIAGLGAGAVLMAAPAPAQQNAAKPPLVSGDMTLSQAVATALTNSPMLAARRAQTAAASARVGMARAMTRPQVSTSTFASMSNAQMIVQSSEGVQPVNLSMAPDASRLNQNVMAMYPLYTGGRLSGGVNQARALEQASSQDAVTAELDVALITKTAYYQVLLARQFVEAYQQRVDEAKERVRIAEEAFSAGRIARFDLLRNQTDLAEAQQQLNNALRDVELALTDLRNAMGVAQSSQINPSESLAAPQTSGNEPGLEELQSRALAQRPEVAAAKARTRSAEAALGVARSAYRPQVYATAMADAMWMSDAGMNGDDFDSSYLVGVTASLPILDGGLRRAGIEEARAMLEQMRAEERDVELGVSRDVSSSFARMSAAASNVTLAQAAIDQAEEDYRVIRMRYEAGRAVNVEVLDALASLTRARTAHAEALYAYNLARETLTRAVGGR